MESFLYCSKLGFIECAQGIQKSSEFLSHQSNMANLFEWGRHTHTFSWLKVEKEPAFQFFTHGNHVWMGISNLGLKKTTIPITILRDCLLSLQTHIQAIPF